MQQGFEAYAAAMHGQVPAGGAAPGGSQYLPTFGYPGWGYPQFAGYGTGWGAPVPGSQAAWPSAPHGPGGAGGAGMVGGGRRGAEEREKKRAEAESSDSESGDSPSPSPARAPRLSRAYSPTRRPTVKPVGTPGGSFENDVDGVVADDDQALLEAADADAPGFIPPLAKAPPPSRPVGAAGAGGPMAGPGDLVSLLSPCTTQEEQLQSIMGAMRFLPRLWGLLGTRAGDFAQGLVCVGVQGFPAVLARGRKAIMAMMDESTSFDPAAVALCEDPLRKLFVDSLSDLAHKAAKEVRAEGSADAGDGPEDLLAGAGGSELVFSEAVKTMAQSQKDITALLRRQGRATFGPAGGPNDSRPARGGPFRGRGQGL